MAAPPPMFAAAVAPPGRDHHRLPFGWHAGGGGGGGGGGGNKNRSSSDPVVIDEALDSRRLEVRACPPFVFIHAYHLIILHVDERCTPFIPKYSNLKIN